MTGRPRTDDEDRLRRPKKRSRKEDARRPILGFVLIGFGAVVLLVVAILVVAKLGSKREPKTGTGGDASAARPGGGSGGSSVVAESNLLTNGSFEDGPEPDAGGPGFTPMEAGSTEIRGWTITRGSIDYIGPYWQHADGRRSLDLNGNVPGAIAQTIRTHPGKKYRVTFSLAGNNCGGDVEPVKTVVVSAAGSEGRFTFDTTGKSYEDMGWLTKTWEFTASAAETTLEFTSVTELTPACGPALDRVSVVELGG
jgi:choice-of-anchor C domain-containing protein